MKDANGFTKFIHFAERRSWGGGRMSLAFGGSTMAFCMSLAAMGRGERGRGRSFYGYGLPGLPAEAAMARRFFQDKVVKPPLRGRACSGTFLGA